MKTTSHGGAQYFRTFIDDFSRKTHVYLLKANEETFEKFKQYKALVENEIGHKIKVLRYDNEREFVSKKFDAFLTECGIQRQTSAPIPHNKMVLQNLLIELSWSVQEAWFLHNG